MLNEFGKRLLALLEERGMTVPELAEEMREKCCGRVCYHRKLSAWDIAGMMTCRYRDELPYRLMFEHFDLMDDVLGIRRDDSSGDLLDEGDADLFRLIRHSTRSPIYRPLFERAEELAPVGLITRKTTIEEAMQVLWSHGESLPEQLVDLLESGVRERWRTRRQN